MKKKRDQARQKQLPFEEASVWQQVPEDAQERVIQLLAEILRDHHCQREAGLDE